MWSFRGGISNDDEPPFVQQTSCMCSPRFEVLASLSHTFLGRIWFFFQCGSATKPWPFWKAVIPHTDWKSHCRLILCPFFRGIWNFGWCKFSLTLEWDDIQPSVSTYALPPRTSSNIALNSRAKGLVSETMFCWFQGILGTIELQPLKLHKITIAPENDGWKGTSLLKWSLFRGELLNFGCKNQNFSCDGDGHRGYFVFAANPMSFGFSCLAIPFDYENNKWWKWICFLLVIF